MIDLGGKSAVVTGGASGIGRAIAMTLAEAGADVLVADVREEPREEGAPTHRVIQDTGRRAGFAHCDVSDSGSVAALVRDAVERFGGIDIMVNNAGIIVEGTALETTDEMFARQLSVNVNGVFYGCREAARAMVAQGRGGKIVNMASISAFRGNPSFAAYCTSKGAVLNMTRQVGLDYAPHDINVNGVAPGFVTTEMTAIYQGPIRAALAGQTPRGKWATAQDIANCVLFLSSSLADHICGETIAVDGGWLIGTPVHLDQ
jgi:3-oxoacyl-[acyl-carrier protein] reductase/meso-butanediol dehydrogenase/(S,S)-butanediol dehydrogenase/diacetyl reductase